LNKRVKKVNFFTQNGNSWKKQHVLQVKSFSSPLHKHDNMHSAIFWKKIAPGSSYLYLLFRA